MLVIGNSFEVSVNDEIGAAVESSLAEIKSIKENYSLDDIIKTVENNKK